MDLNLKSRTKKLLEENIKGNLCIPELDKNFLATTPKPQATEKTDNLDFCSS